MFSEFDRCRDRSIIEEWNTGFGPSRGAAGIRIYVRNRAFRSLKRVLLDHNVPARLARYLKTCEVSLADEMGWARISNGKLLEISDKSGFEVLLAGDKSLKYEQNIIGAILALFP